MRCLLKLLSVSLFLMSCGDDTKEDKTSNSNENQDDWGNLDN